MAVALALPFTEELVPREASKVQSAALAFASIAVGSAFLLIAILPVISSRYTRIAFEAELRGELKSAQRNYSLAASVCPDNTDAVFSATRVLARQERYSEALVWSARTKLFVAEPEVWILRARILESMNENGLALAEMQNAQRLFPYSSEPRAEIEAILSNSPR
jgi:hypothetical protein